MLRRSHPSSGCLGGAPSRPSNSERTFFERDEPFCVGKGKEVMRADAAGITAVGGRVRAKERPYKALHLVHPIPFSSTYLSASLFVAVLRAMGG